MRSKRLPIKLRQIRARLSLTQEGLLVQLGLEKKFSKKHVSSWELPSNHPRNTEPPLPVLLKLSRYLGICLAVLIDDELELPETLPARWPHWED